MKNANITCYSRFKASDLGKEANVAICPSGKDPRRGGFTLVELLVVVLIIGILSAVALPQYQKAVDKARYTQARTLLESIWQGEQLFYLENGKYSKSLDDLDIELPTPQKNEFLSGTHFYEYSWGDCSIHDTGYIKCSVTI